MVTCDEAEVMRCVAKAVGSPLQLGKGVHPTSERVYNTLEVFNLQTREESVRCLMVNIFISQ